MENKVTKITFKSLIRDPLFWYLTLFILGAVFLLSTQGFSQIGYTKQEISQRDTLFKSCEVYDDFIITKTENNSIFIFNFDKDFCFYITGLVQEGNEDLVHLINSFELRGVSWSSSLSYSDNFYVYKIYTNYSGYEKQVKDLIQGDIPVAGIWKNKDN